MVYNQLTTGRSNWNINAPIFDFNSKTFIPNEQNIVHVTPLQKKHKIDEDLRSEDDSNTFDTSDTQDLESEDELQDSLSDENDNEECVGHWENYMKWEARRAQRVETSQTTPPSQTKTEQSTNSIPCNPPPPKIKHENAIFGSYLLEDVRCIFEVVINFQNNSNTRIISEAKVQYDLFNFETVKELVKTKGLSNVFETNLKFLKNQTLITRRFGFNVHYEKCRNDLTEKEGSVSIWQKYCREYTKNMIFFNPYLDHKEGTEQLIIEFFKYASQCLHEDGIVTMMWNYRRSDALAAIDLDKLALDQKFKPIRRLKVSSFFEQTKFRHFKNSNTLNRAKSAGGKYYVHDFANSQIVFFKRGDQNISQDNIIATALEHEIEKV